ncbi:hypothetical protein ACIGW8_35840 [Streptomyces sioyaensis]|uniref:hypothetical protein n=1 Tax=Streptomyces sioyaensis TaxID=67364 RepID=UPI0037D3E740
MSTDPFRVHAEQVVNAFIAPPRRERLLELLASPKKWEKFRQELPHAISGRFDERWARSLDTHEQNPEALETLLRGAGAPDTCVVISESPSQDGERPLRQALEDVVGYSYGAFVSCIPGVLAYFESEDCNRILLHRPEAR